jgi:hypothetical protein
VNGHPFNAFATLFLRSNEYATLTQEGWFGLIKYAYILIDIERNTAETLGLDLGSLEGVRFALI